MIRQFAKHHNKIQFFGYEVANVVLVAQQAFQRGTTGYGLNYETCSALSLLAGSVCIWKFEPEQRPHLLFYGGIALTIGGLFLITAGYSMTGLAVTIASLETARGGLLNLQNYIDKQRKKDIRVKRFLGRTLKIARPALGWYLMPVDYLTSKFQRLGRLINERPFITGALIKAPMRLEFIVKKVLIGDWIGAAVGLSWMTLGDVALAFNDAKLQALIEQRGVAPFKQWLSPRTARPGADPLGAGRLQPESPTMPKLSDLFADLFVCVLLFEERLREGRELPSCMQIRREINTLLAEQDRVARRQNIPEQNYQEARFVVLAWIDEIILGCLTGAAFSQWKAKPLQLEHYPTRQACAELSERWSALRADQRQVREIYDLCFGLGLNDQRHRETIGATPLRFSDESTIPLLTPQLYETSPTDSSPKSEGFQHQTLETARTVTRSLGSIFSCLTDQWRTRRRKRFATLYPRKVGLVLLVMIPILLAFLAATLLPPPSPPSESGQRITPSPQPHMAALPQPDPVDLRMLDHQTDPDRPMRSSPIPPSPFQEVRDFLQPLTKQAQAHGLTMTFKATLPDDVRGNAKQAHPTYRLGDNLMIDIQTPTDYSSFVYVEYYDATGRVAHLFPNPMQPTNHFRPGSTFTLGDPQGPARWRVSPPSGHDLVVVIASKQPLFGQTNLTSESIDSALSALRQALQGVAQSDVIVAFSLLTIQDRPSPRPASPEGHQWKN